MAKNSVKEHRTVDASQKNCGAITRAFGRTFICTSPAGHPELLHKDTKRADFEWYYKNGIDEENFDDSNSELFFWALLILIWLVNVGGLIYLVVTL